MKIELRGAGPLISLDDDSVFQYILKHAYGKSGLDNEMVALQSAAELFEYLDDLDAKQLSFSAAILDINMPGAYGIDLLSSIKEKYPNMASSPVYLLSSVSSTDEVVQANERGAAGLYTKPSDVGDYEFIAVA